MADVGPWAQPELRRWIAAAAGAADPAELRAAAGHLPSSGARAAALTLLDLRAADWTIAPNEGCKPTLCRPSAEDAREDDAQRRADLSRARDEQLREPASRAFIARMESARLHSGGLRSIFDVLRDGPTLARALEEAGSDADALHARVRPQVQVVSPGARCAATGLLLSDIWRYMRHGWATPYRSAPGRGLAVLVRDAAAPNAPVMGIGLLASAPAQLRARDRWIGWDPQQVLDECRSRPTAARACWLLGALHAELDELYINDLIEDGALTPSTLTAPTAAAIDALRAESSAAAAAHRRYAGAGAEGWTTADDRSHVDGPTWEARARSLLYRAKRAALLAALLRARLALGGLTQSADVLRSIAATGAGGRAILTVARRAKARRLGSCLAELTVCGAVDPYRALLGGKLIAALMAGPEVRAAWAARYGQRDAQIASAMAGRPVQRGGILGLIGTTSLYGPGAQYNRAASPQARPDGQGAHLARYERIGATRGYGTSHLGAATRAALAQLVAEARGGARPTSRMAEGVSPRLRVVREGLELLGLDTDALLQHGAPRAIYVVALGASAREWLRGEAEDPQLYADPVEGPSGDATSDLIARYWLERWVVPRLARPQALAEVARHSVARPPRHGARVLLPPAEP